MATRSSVIEPDRASTPATVMRILPTIRRTAAVLALLVPGAAAQVTWVVDDDPGPGVDFTDIQPALAVAGPFDLIDVNPGQYSAFSMTVARRIMGRAGAVVAGHSVVQTIGQAEWALIADLRLESLGVENCAGTVMLDGIRCTQGRDALVVTGCADVRARALTILGGATSGGARVRVSASRVQIDSSQIQAAFPNQEGNYGQVGLDATNASFVHISTSTLMGGRGGDGILLLFFVEPGDGAPALRLDTQSTARIVRSTLRGGAGGLDPEPPFDDADHGSGLLACGGAHETWDSTIEAGTDPSSFAPPAPDIVLDCGATLSSSVDLPSFRVVGAVTSGAAVTLEAGAGAGSSVRIIVGRFPEIVPVPGTTIPRLVDLGRIGSLGAVPSNGIISAPIVVPNYPRGSQLFMQTSRTNSSGTDFSNSSLFLVR